MSDEVLDLNSDDLLCSFGQATATGLGQVVEGSVSHDRITRALSVKKRTGKDLWRMVKPLIRKMQSEDGVMIVDDAIQNERGMFLSSKRDTRNLVLFPVAATEAQNEMSRPQIPVPGTGTGMGITGLALDMTDAP